MNILQILPELHVGGVETGTVELARHLVRMKHKAVVVSSGGPLVKELEACGAIHYQLPVHKKSLFFMIRMAGKLVEIIKKEKIDIVHARSRVPAWSAYWACRRTNAAFVTTCHGYYTRHPFSRVMGWGKRVIVLSTVIARHMMDDFGVPHERIRLIPRSVDLERFKFRSPQQKRRPGQLHIGIIGRITPIKGHTFFIKAMAKVARSQENPKIWIIGEAPSSKAQYKEELQLLVRRLGLAEHTEFLGTQRDIPQILAHLDLLVLATTTHEAFGRVIVEAQACGVPVVATRVGGVIDIIEHEKTGLLVPPQDPQAMAEAVIRLGRDKNLAETLAQNAYEKVKNEYSLPLLVKNTIEVYREALTQHKLLVIKMSALGDIILSTAALRAIREHFKSPYHISCLVGEQFKDALLRCPYIDELLVADLRGRDKGYKGILKVGSFLREKGFDMVIDLQNNRRSHILGFLSHASQRYGYGNRKLGFFINRKVTDKTKVLGPVEHQFMILRLLGIDSTDYHLELWPREDEYAYIDEFISSQWVRQNQALVGINLNASSRWATKCLPFDTMVKVCDALGMKDMRPVITGMQEDSAEAQKLAAQVKSAKIINACGKTTVNQLACLIERCSVFITGDSAPLHIAAAVKTPIVALFGPTDPARHLPPAEQCVVLRKNVACGPCYRPSCKTKKCMDSIHPQEVLAAVEGLLSKNQPVGAR